LDPQRQPKPHKSESLILEGFKKTKMCLNELLKFQKELSSLSDQGGVGIPDPRQEIEEKAKILSKLTEQLDRTMGELSISDPALIEPKIENINLRLSRTKRQELKEALESERNSMIELKDLYERIQQLEREISLSSQ